METISLVSNDTEIRTNPKIVTPVFHRAVRIASALIVSVFACGAIYYEKNSVTHLGIRIGSNDTQYQQSQVEPNRDEISKISSENLELLNYTDEKKDEESSDTQVEPPDGASSSLDSVDFGLLNDFSETLYDRPSLARSAPPEVGTSKIFPGDHGSSNDVTAKHDKPPVAQNEMHQAATSKTTWDNNVGSLSATHEKYINKTTVPDGDLEDRISDAAAKTSEKIPNNSIHTQNTRPKSETSKTFSNDLGSTDNMAEKKSSLVIHAGPHKTGTSTIQSDFEINNELLTNTTQYYYFGKYTMYSEFDCPPPPMMCINHQLLTEPTPENITTFINDMEEYHRNGLDVIFSTEGMSRKIMEYKVEKRHSNIFLAALDEIRNNWDITVLLSYRRYFEWTVSSYNSVTKTKKGKSFYYWPGKYAEMHKMDKNIRSDEEPSFIEWYKGITYDTACPNCYYNYVKFWGPEYHPTEYTARMFRERFEGISVNIYNMHQTGDLFINFVCQVMPLDAKDFCEALRRGQGKFSSNLNPTRPFENERLAVAAYNAGLILDARLTKKDVTKRIMKKFPDMTLRKKFKYLCPTQFELDQMLQLSLQYETSLFLYMDKYEKEQNYDEKSKERERSHRLKFEEYVDTHRFCNWDVKHMLHFDKEIQDWFKTLRLN